MNAMERIISLLNRAGHKNTPEEEARSCALIAARLFVKHEFTISSKQTEVEKPVETPTAPWEEPSRDFSFVEVDTFRVDTSKYKSSCLKCLKLINTGEVVATVNGKGSTHYRCRHYWTKK